MSLIVDDEKLKEIAADLGLEITFNSETPGVFNKTTGEHKPFEDFFPELKALESND